MGLWAYPSSSPLWRAGSPKANRRAWPRLPRYTPLLYRALVAVAVILACSSIPLTAHAVSLLDDPVQYTFAQDYMLQQINRERVGAGLDPVRLDPAAGQAAKQHADDMLAGGYFSHWDMAGLKPTRRWNLLGRFDALGENIYFAHNITGGLTELLDKAMETLMASEGHRRTLLGSNYTHVGLGFSANADGKQLYVAQEFIARLGGEYSFPLAARVGDQPQVTGRFDPGVFEFAQLVVGFEGLPEKRNVLWLNRTEAYRDGDKLLIGYTPYPNLSFKDMETSHEINVESDSGRFSCAVKLDYKSKPGTYYIFIWLKHRRTGEALLAAAAAVEVRR